MPVMILLLLWPPLEIAGFVWIGGAIGLAPTFAFILASGLVGAALMRRAGIAALRALGAGPQAGETPFPAVLDGAWRFLAGVLLVLPGFLSSAVGLLLFLPPIRARSARLAAKRFGPRGAWAAGFAATARREAGATIIEGEFREVPPALPRRR